MAIVLLTYRVDVVVEVNTERNKVERVVVEGPVELDVQTEPIDHAGGNVVQKEVEAAINIANTKPWPEWEHNI